MISIRIDCCVFIFTSLVVSCWLFCIHGSSAGNSLSVGHVMRDWQFLESSDKRFRLLFFTSGPSSSRYLGIQYMDFLYEVDSNSVTEQLKMVWVANRDNPLPDSSGVLSITQDGYLVLTVSDGNTVVTINEQKPALLGGNTSVKLLDTGNLVLTDQGNHILWQSFDYPSDTWLPGMKLGLIDSSNGHQPPKRFLTSWVSELLPNLGAFSIGVDPNNTKQLVIWKRGVLYWRSGIWNGYNFSYFPDHGFKLKFSYFSNVSQSYFTFTTGENNFTQCIYIESSGDIGIFEISDQGTTYGYGPINYCQNDQVEYRSKGCVARDQPSYCTAGDLFTKISGSMSDWSTYVYNVSWGISDCKDMCTRDCSCTAYASALSDGSGCKLSRGIKDNSLYEIFYLRNGILANNDSIFPAPSYAPMYTSSGNPSDWDTNPPNNSTPDNSNKRKLGLPVGIAAAFLAFVTLIFFACYRWRRKHCIGGNNGRSNDRTNQGTLSVYDLRSEAIIIDKISNGEKDYKLPLFTLSSIEIATNSFSDANKIGQGGFGPVYKGKSVNGEEIAVKRLSKSSGQGLEEFMNEVILISRLQHRNLVRLLGCCTQGDERILIYEYMPNKSLDSFIFDVTRRALLNWKMRVSIIEGIAQGLQYLHKYSRLKIIHRDLKTSNILLDSDMKPKISDFGTAKIFGDNESCANTRRIAGTPGYMSPEYAIDGLFSVKSDVFSFGVMMLEIISGKKNTGFYQPDRALNLLGYAWNLWKEGRGLEIMDDELAETCSTSEVIRYIQVGFLCVQESAVDRPTISDVISMLGNEMISLPTPKQPAFSAIVGLPDANVPEIPKPCSVNNLTISELGGR